MATDRNLIIHEDDDSLEIPDTEALQAFSHPSPAPSPERRGEY
jgi:hypothetical protein